MATGYEAVVRIKPVDAGLAREDRLLELVAANLPPEARVSAEHAAAGDLLLSVSILVQANDASEVQIAARDLVTLALERAGLTEQAALLDDVDVRSGS